MVEGVKTCLGGLHSAKICLYSVDFHEIEWLQQQAKWQEAGRILADAAKAIEVGGAGFLLICSNTMHKVAPLIESEISIPLLHIADATAQQLIADGVTRVGLLGTRFTMEQDFYKEKLIKQYHIDVVVPEPAEREMVDRVIFSELCLGNVNPASRDAYLKVMDSMHARGAQAIILGCTEIDLLISSKYTDIPLYDTTAIHCAAAVQSAIQE
ncbi:MAG: L-aspartate/glutamate-specific racemase [Candidatus Celerinatantimonas neptuna]|nr:MAG: L-aspartate/glutamate-specific racemase [Candidatus Celerinatantimonas neptuna]